MTTTAITRTDVGANEWRIDDELVRLRVWGTDHIHALPRTGSEWTIGSLSTSGIRLQDRSGRVSRRHALLVRAGTAWIIRDLESKNGIHLDGARRAEVKLEPGVEVGIGGVVLIAESSRLIELRAFLSRVIGWTTDRVEAVDLALRAVRAASARRATLVLSGEDDLVPIAQTIHRYALGDDRPFVTSA